MPDQITPLPLNPNQQAQSINANLPPNQPTQTQAQTQPQSQGLAPTQAPKPTAMAPAMAKTALTKPPAPNPTAVTAKHIGHLAAIGQGAKKILEALYHPEYTMQMQPDGTQQAVPLGKQSRGLLFKHILAGAILGGAAGEQAAQKLPLGSSGLERFVAGAGAGMQAQNKFQQNQLDREQKLNEANRKQQLINQQETQAEKLNQAHVAYYNQRAFAEYQKAVGTSLAYHQSVVDVYQPMLSSIKASGDHVQSGVSAAEAIKIVNSPNAHGSLMPVPDGIQWIKTNGKLTYDFTYSIVDKDTKVSSKSFTSDLNAWGVDHNTREYQFFSTHPDVNLVDAVTMMNDPDIQAAKELYVKNEAIKKGLAERQETTAANAAKTKLALENSQARLQATEQGEAIHAQKFQEHEYQLHANDDFTAAMTKTHGDIVAAIRLLPPEERPYLYQNAQTMLKTTNGELEAIHYRPGTTLSGKGTTETLVNAGDQETVKNLQQIRKLNEDIINAMTPTVQTGGPPPPKFRIPTGTPPPGVTAFGKNAILNALSRGIAPDQISAQMAAAVKSHQMDPAVYKSAMIYLKWFMQNQTQGTPPPKTTPAPAATKTTPPPTTAENPNPNENAFDLGGAWGKVF